MCYFLLIIFFGEDPCYFGCCVCNASKALIGCFSICPLGTVLSLGGNAICDTLMGEGLGLKSCVELFDFFND